MSVRRTPKPDGSLPERRAGIYPPREDTFLLLPFATVPFGTRVLEVGTGSGLLALTAARSGGRVVATDRSLTALRELRRSASREHLDVRPVRTDLARGVGRFDRVLANPPYLPSLPAPSAEEPETRLALDGGPDGCRVLSRLVSDLPEHLFPGAEAFVVVSTVQNPRALASIREDWQDRGGLWSTVASRRLEGEELSVWRLVYRPRPSPAGFQLGCSA